MEAGVSIPRSLYDLTSMNLADSQNQCLSLVPERRISLREKYNLHVCFKNCHLSGS